jgi:hypothetical protein
MMLRMAEDQNYQVSFIRGLRLNRTQMARIPPKHLSKIALGFLGVALAILGGVLIGRTISRGDDFLVFYHVAHRFWDGVRPYDQITYGNMVFKYPPWILPFFLPFGVIDLLTAKVVWGVVQAGSLVAVAVRLHRGVGKLPPVRPLVQGVLLLSLFGLVGSHGMTGQITLPVLALALWLDPVRDRFLKFFILAWAMSAKVTSLFPLIHAWRRRRLALALAGCAVLFLVLSLPIYVKSYDKHSKAMRIEWAQAMFSGTEDVNSVRIGFTTREVQGLPSLLLRKGGLDEKNPAHVLGTIAFSAILLGGLWLWLSRNLSFHAQWIGWLALLPAVQPLAWFHVFLLAYPALAFAAEFAVRARNGRRVALALVCTLLLGAVTAKTFGGVGAELELWSVKLWGAFGALALFLSQVDRDPKSPLGSKT